jgi:putative ABC transport system permease protein
MGTLWQDIRYGFRMMLKGPGFTAVAVLALSLGIGANTAIFSVVNAVLLRPLPFDNPERIMTIGGERDVVSYPDFADWREQSQTLEHIAAYNTSATLLDNGDEFERIIGVIASTDLLPLLNVKPVMGRNFTREEDSPGSAAVVVLSYELWQRRFNSDPNIVGKEIMLGKRSTTVVGVLPPGFRFPVEDSRTDYVQPLAPAMGERLMRRSSYSLTIIMRLKPDVTPQQAESEMKAIGERLEQQYPDEGFRLGSRLLPLHEELVGQIRPALLLMLGAVGFVLLIACANVANLLLARAAGRQKEIAIRTALGASRSRVLRQLLTESLLLSLLGGGLGLLLALWGVDLLVTASPLDIPRVKEIGLDSHVLGFTLLVSTLTGIIFGLAPALQASKPDFNEALKEGGRGSTEGLRRNRVRSLLVISEVALSLVLLIGAGLLLKSFMRLREVNPGFDSHHVLTTSLSPSKAKYRSAAELQNFFQETLRQITTLPGIESAGLVDPLPLSGNNSGKTFKIEGRADAAAQNKPASNYRAISPDYFQAMSIPLLKGRAFTEHDNGEAPNVVIVNETFARRFFPGEDPLGKRIVVEADPTENPNPPLSEIVGVVGDVRHRSLDVPAGPEFYAPYLQAPESSMDLVVRTQTDNPASLAMSVRDRIRQVDKDQYIPKVIPMDQLLAASIARRRFNMMLLGIFASVALLLAGVGIFGVMNYSVTQRTHEIGIRMALGAQQRDVLKMIVGQGMILALVGVAAGLTAALILTRLMSGLLYGVSATDPLTFAGVSVLLAVVVLMACYIPARRATKVDPMVALRHE